MKVKCVMLAGIFLVIASFINMEAFMAGAKETKADTKLIFVGDFETGDLSEWRVSGNSPEITFSPTRAGKYAMKTPLDRYKDKVAYRTEVSGPGSKVGGEYWYGFSIFLPEDYVADSIWEIVAQWHGVPDFDIGENWRNPVMALSTNGGKWSLVNRWDAKANTFESGKRVYGGTKNYNLGPYQTQVWTDWVVHVKWSYQAFPKLEQMGNTEARAGSVHVRSDGILEVWKDGKKVVEQKGPNTFNDAKGPYFKMGLYKGWKDPNRAGDVVSKRVLYHDEFRMAGADATYEDVAPGGGEPNFGESSSSGPLPGVKAIGAGAQHAVPVLTVKLDKPIGEQTTVSFWMRPDAWYGNGEGRENIQHQLMEIPGVARCVFRQAKAACNLSWRWDKSKVKGVDAMSTNLPELPGPEWYHVLYTWDAKQGLFDAFVNGAPQRVPGTKVAPWTMESRGEIRLNVSPFQLAEVSVEPAYLPPEQAQMRVPAQYRGRRARLFGIAGHRLPMKIENRLGEMLYESSLGSRESIDGWVMEGPGVLKFEDGWMQMSSQDTDAQEGHIVHWCPKDFPERFVAEWEVQPISKYGLCIVFFAAKGQDGQGIFDPRLPKRNGVFSQYTNGAIISYHISYYANTPFNPGRITSNMRKNNNFYLVANGPPGIPTGSKEGHGVRLIKDGAHAQLSVDSQLIIDFVDDGKRYGPVHGDGKIGLSQMKWMVARYRNLRVWELKAP